MLEIQQALYRGTSQIQGRTCAVVDIVPLQQEYGSLTAYLAPIQHGGYEIVQITQQGASSDAASSQQMSQVVPGSSEMFVENIYGTEWNAKSHILDNLLCCEEVREQLGQAFGQ